MATKKAVIERHLTHGTTYTIVDSAYSEAPCICQNCDALIHNIGYVKNASGQLFQVGLDCAATLSGIDGSTGMTQAQKNFREMKKVRSAVKKHLKIEGADVYLEYSTKGAAIVMLLSGGKRVGRMSMSYEFLNTYLSDMKQYATNPQKEAYFTKRLKEEDLALPQYRQNLKGNIIEPVKFIIENHNVEIKCEEVLSEYTGRKYETNIVEITSIDGKSENQRFEVVTMGHVTYYIASFLNKLLFESL